MKILDPQFGYLLMTVLSMYKPITTLQDAQYLQGDLHSNKSTKVLNFIKCNLYNFPADTKRTAYLTLVRPIMEYVAPVWDPDYNVDIYVYIYIYIYMFKKVQRREYNLEFLALRHYNLLLKYLP